jgi:predicted amidohydrolase
MNDLNITLIQTSIFWEEVQKNLDHFDMLLGGISNPTDLILLPETFNTGFSINPAACAETMDGPSVRFLLEKAAEKHTVIMATLLIEEEGHYFNRLVCVYPDGKISTYDKRHLFRLSEEYRIFSGGKSQLIAEVKGWKILPLVCYDLRFPVWSRNTWKDGIYGYDLTVCLANWPASRSHVWKTLLAARAIENQAYIAGVNRIGHDGHGTWHAGETTALDAKGNILYAAPEGKEEIHTVCFSAEDLRLFRESFTVGMDWDKFTIITK